jgi:hypothetical protein
MLLEPMVLMTIKKTNPVPFWVDLGQLSRKIILGVELNFQLTRTRQIQIGNFLKI